MTEATALLTAADLLRMPDDGWRYELRQGVLIRMSPTCGPHGRVGMRLARRLADHVEDRDLGVVYMAETGFRLSSDPDTVHAPDISFVRADRIGPEGEPEGFFPGPPDLAVEVTSPSDTADEISEKIAEYLAAGCLLVVVMYLRRRQIGVYRPDGSALFLNPGDTLVLDPVVPGFACPVAELFA